jgi:PAS domain S-box-containing protein
LHRVLLTKNSRGEPDHLVGRLTDITERRDTEEKLTRQAALLDKTRDGIMVLNLDHTIKYWNKGAGAIYGWTAEEALGRRQDELRRTRGRERGVVRQPQEKDEGGRGAHS